MQTKRKDHEAIYVLFFPRCLAQILLQYTRPGNTFFICFYKNNKCVFLVCGEFIYSFDLNVNHSSKMSVDQDGTLYVACGNQVKLWNSEGVYLRTFESEEKINGICVAEDKVFMTETNNKRVSVFDKQGKYFRRFSGYINDNDDTEQFNEPFDVVAFKDVLYICDQLLNCVQIFTKQGDFIYKFGGFGTRQGEFVYPSGLAMDSENKELYVSDDNRIQVFSLDGKFIRRFGSSGFGKLSIPNSLYFYDSKVFVSDTGNNRIVIFDAHNGNFLQDIFVLDPKGIVVHEEQIYVVSNNNINVFCYSFKK